MSTDTFSFAELEALRQSARKDLARSDGPDRPPPGWSIHPGDPARILQGHTSLKLRDGLVLRAYRYYWGNGGFGKVWALPAGAEFPEPPGPASVAPPAAPGFWAGLKQWYNDSPPARQTGGGPSDVPRPPKALGDFAEALEGDGSPRSYLCASILVRDLRAFGEFWHNVDWGAHLLLDVHPQERLKRHPWKPEPPPAAGAPPAPPMGAWTTSAPEPAVWAPTVETEGNAAVVTFYTYCGKMREGIYRHVDRFKRGAYTFSSKDEKIAEGMGGYIS
ncbi:MAG: hypothetical protein KIS92_23640 [Planctomycetota bacterium]|nr:hypothetical protein [Planctomycetota bacterium]